MKIKNFITTIQWGNGMHYIIDTYDNENQVEYSIAFHRKNCDKKAKGKKGAKATIRAWKLVDESKPTKI